MGLQLRAVTNPPGLELASFWRTFAWLMALVVLPSAGLSGFGVLAIINERAAVEKRLEAAWGGKLEQLGQQLQEALTGASVSETEQGLVVRWEGAVLSGPGFRVRAGELQAGDAALRTALAPLVPLLGELGAAPRCFSLTTARGTLLLVAAVRDGDVAGARLEPKRLEPLLASLGTRLAGAEPVRFELQPLHREEAGGSLVNRLVTEVERARSEALAPPPLAWRVMPPPLQDFRVAAVPSAGDPVAAASLRNRVLYGVLLGLFYVALAVGVVYVVRTLHREARLSRMKTDFVSLVSHELRTPLTSIRMFIETLSMGRVTDPEQTRQVLQLLSRETERLSEMIERVLDWGRIESGRRTYTLLPGPVDPVLEAALQAFRAQRLSAEVEVQVEVEPGLPRVRVDREALAGALLNLVQNAFKYTGEHRRIRVRARRERKGVAIDVEDNGPGIAPREQRRVFERFYRVDDLLTRRTEGSGLGLSIAQRITEAHGGKLTLQSTVGVGSCFTVHLPAVEDP
jgi:two-component system phosphate regulon sensor histidine kinase PhoR